MVDNYLWLPGILQERMVMEEMLSLEEVVLGTQIVIAVVQ